jgi:hypothetical protein
VFDPAMKQEIEADAFARELLCRNPGRSLDLQQRGVDWLFGFWVLCWRCANEL